MNIYKTVIITQFGQQVRNTAQCVGFMLNISPLYSDNPGLKYQHTWNHILVCHRQPQYTYSPSVIVVVVYVMAHVMPVIVTVSILPLCMEFIISPGTATMSILLYPYGCKFTKCKNPATTLVLMNSGSRTSVFKTTYYAFREYILFSCSLNAFLKQLLLCKH